MQRLQGGWNEPRDRSRETRWLLTELAQSVHCERHLSGHGDLSGAYSACLCDPKAGCGSQGGARRRNLSNLRDWVARECVIISAVSEPAPHQLICLVEILCEIKERGQREDMRNSISVEKNMKCYLTCIAVLVGQRQKISRKERKRGTEALLFLNLFISHIKSFCVTSGVSQEDRNLEGTILYLSERVKYSPHKSSCIKEGLKCHLRSRTFPGFLKGIVHMSRVSDYKKQQTQRLEDLQNRWLTKLQHGHSSL